MDKKFIYIAGGGLLLVIILIIVLVTGKGRTKTVAVPKQTILTVWDYNNEKSAYDQIITSFQQERNLKVQYVVKNTDTYLEDTVNAIAAGNGPDVWVVPANILPKYKDKLVVMPPNGFADATAKKDDIEGYQDLYPSVVVSDNILDGKIYGAPIAIDYLRLYVNNTLINNAINEYQIANPGKNTNELYNSLFTFTTWDSLVNTVKFVTKKSGTSINRSGIAMGTSTNILNSSDILTLLMLQNGAKMTSDDLSTAQFHTAQNQFGNIQYPGTKALEFYTSFANPKNENYTWNNTMGNDIRAFAEGKTAMLFAYSSAASEIKNISPNLNYRTLDVPQIKETKNPVNLASYDTLVVTKSAKDPLMAWRFIKKCIDPQYSNGYFSVTQKINAKNTADPKIKILKSWYNPDPNKTKSIFADIITQVNNGANAQTALDGAAGQITTLLGKLKNQ